MNKTCQLCGGQKLLRNSHIIPKFVLRWLKRTSVGGIRSVNNPNQRVQDGEKIYMLCADCELLFSKWEKEFSETIFIPIHESSGEQKVIGYRNWALKFAVSVSWRSLKFVMEQGQLTHLSEEQLILASRAEEVWREFLLGLRKHPEEFVQHLIPVDTIRDHNISELSSMINRYLLRATDIDVVCADDTVFVYTKMCRLILIGSIQSPSLNAWQGTRIHANRGTFGSMVYKVPAPFGNYLSYKADRVSLAMSKMSDKQREKIAETINANREQFTGSEMYRAMEQDIHLFGDDAFNDI